MRIVTSRNKLLSGLIRVGGFMQSFPDCNEPSLILLTVVSRQMGAAGSRC